MADRMQDTTLEGTGDFEALPATYHGTMLAEDGMIGVIGTIMLAGKPVKIVVEFPNRESVLTLIAALNMAIDYPTEE